MGLIEYPRRSASRDTRCQRDPKIASSRSINRFSMEVTKKDLPAGDLACSLITRSRLFSHVVLILQPASRALSTIGTAEARISERKSSGRSSGISDIKVVARPILIAYIDRHDVRSIVI
jgi:hypothetical protein